MKKTTKEAFIKNVLIQTILKDNEKVRLCSTIDEMKKKLNQTLAVWTNEQNIALSEKWYDLVFNKCVTLNNWQPLAIEEISFLKIGSIISFNKEAVFTDYDNMKHFSVIVLAIDEKVLKYRLGSSFGKVKASNFKNYFWMMKLSEDDKKILFWKTNTNFIEDSTEKTNSFRKDVEILFGDLLL